MARRLAKGLFWAIAGLVAAVGLLDTGLRFANFDSYLRDRLIAEVRKKGRDVAIDGPMTARLLPLPHVEAALLTLRNHEGKPLLSAKSATFRPVLRAVLSRDFLAWQMEVQSPQIVVSFDRAGQLNWRLPPHKDGAHRIPNMQVAIRGGTITVRDERRPGARLAIDHADIALLVDQESLNIDAGLSVDGKRTTLKANLARSASEHLTGPLDVQVESLAAILDSWSRFRGDEHPPDLGGAFLGSFSVGTTRLEWTGKALSIKEATFSLGARRRDGQALGTTRGVANLALALPPHLNVALGLEIPELQFPDFMTGHANWVALGQLFADKSLAALDATPADGSVKIALAVDKGFLNDQPVQGINVTVTLADHRGTLTTSASLPGGTHLRSQTTLSGERDKRQIEGSIELSGEAPAKTLQWLLPKWLQPDKPTPGVIAAAPFDISLKVTPLGVGMHSIDANVLLGGVRGTATTTVKIASETGSRADLDGSFRIGSLDLFSYMPVAARRGMQSLKLGGVDFRFRSAIDLGNPALPMDVLSADLGAKQVEIGLTPPPAAPAVSTPARGTLLDSDTTRVFGGWLAALPARLDAYAHAGPARSTLAKAFPSIRADLTRLETALYHLNFKTPFRMHAARLVLDEGDRRGMLSDVSLGVVARAVPGHRKISTVFARASVGPGQIDGAHVASASLDFEADLDRSEATTQVSAIRLQRLSLEGDVEDPVDPYGQAGVVGLPPVPRRAPVSLVAQGVADPGHISVTIDRLVAGDLADFRDVEIEASEDRGGLLSVAISNAAAAARAEDLPRPRCSLSNRAGPHVLEFTVELAGADVTLDEAYSLLDAGNAERGPHRALIRRLSAQGFATTDVAILQDLRLRLGDSSTASARIAATKLPANQGLAQLEGCIDASLQDRPRLASIGHLGQDLLLPALAPLWKEAGGKTGIGLAGRVLLRSDGLGSGAPLRIAISRPGHPADESFDVELHGLHLRLPEHARVRTPLRIGLQGIGFSDGFGGFKFVGSNVARPMLAFEQRPLAGNCGNQPVMRAEISLGPLDHIDIPAVKRFVTHVGALAKGNGPGLTPSACEALDLHLTAERVQAWPDLVDAFTDLAGAKRAAEQAPALHDLDFSLRVGKDRTVAYVVNTRLVPAGAQASPPCAPGETFYSKGLLAFANGKWLGNLEGKVTCLGLDEVLRIADATVGHRIESPAVSLRAGHFREISFDLKLPAFSLTDLSQASGNIKWDGNLALDIENSRIQKVISLLDLQTVRRQGFKTTGEFQLREGNVTGVMAFIDPLLDHPPDDSTGRNIKAWPNIVQIDVHGGLSKPTIGAEATVRSPEWPGEQDIYVCVGKAPPIHSFPKFVEKLSICISPNGGKQCPKLVEPRAQSAADYRCGTTAR